MPESPARDLAPGATDVVEADTAEAAIEQVHRRFGPDARIIEARRALRGGLGGFFAREVVELHVASPVQDVVARPEEVAPNEAASAPERDAVAPVDRLLGRDVVGAEPDSSELAAVVAGLTARAADAPEEVDFATYLRRQLGTSAHAHPAGAGTEPTGPSDGDELRRARAAFLERARPAAPDAPGTALDLPDDAALAGAGSVDIGGVPLERIDAALDAVPVPFAASADGPATPDATVGPAWSATELLRLGVPVDLVRSLEVAEGDDDLAWTTAVAEAVRPLCRPLPVGASVLVGPQAYEVAGASDLGDAPAARSDRWRAALGSARWTHLVVGGDGWRDALRADVLAVSWTRERELPDALRCATELGLVLGCGPIGGVVRRATPLDVALELRALVVDR